MAMMKIFCLKLFLVGTVTSSLFAADEVLFEDDFENGLSDRWQIVGLAKEDYRIRDGALELRVQPGKYKRETPMLKIILPLHPPAR
jgi:hypothetical protein